VHSKLQIMASVLPGGKSLPQFSQTGLISSIYLILNSKTMTRKL